MKAINLTGKAPTERQKLIDLLPLSTPLVVQIFPIYSCNFKCNYCLFQIPLKERHFISECIKMDLNLFKKSIDDMSNFPEKIKTLRFVGIGEPLLHPDIVEMVEYSKQKDVAEKIEIITNGMNLYKKMSLDLVKAGLDRIVISVQGTSEKKYKQITGASVDIKFFTKHLKFLYDNKEQCEIYIKVVDSCLDCKHDEDQFCSIFGDICDYIAIESTVPIHEGVELPERDRTQFGQDLKHSSICPQPFYHIQMNPDGFCVPCQSFEYPIILGDCRKESVVDVWKGDTFKAFRDCHVKGINNLVCNNCKMKTYRMHESDILPIEKMEELF